MKLIKVFALLATVFGLTEMGMAAPVDAGKASAAVTNWLRFESAPLGAKLGHHVKNVETYNDSSGKPIYHVVYLDPAGFVIVAAEDQVDPIIAFVGSGHFDSSKTNPLGAMISRDIPARVANARKHSRTASGIKSQSKWQLLAGGSTTNTPEPNPMPTSSITDLRIAPFVRTAWDQWTADNSLDSGACYNFFTPPFDEGYQSNVVCGCVATALAQLMYYYSYPTIGVGTGSYTVSFDGDAMTRQLRGGDGKGAPYNWALMPLTTSAATPIGQCEAIGTLTYDAGVATHMQYTDTPSGSATTMSDEQTALLTTFQYGNAILTEAGSINIGYDLTDMLDADLDARLPVTFGIVDTGGNGHCVLCDGYGYSVFSTLYHHINMGWGGLDNAWYQLPVLPIFSGTNDGPFYIFDACLYNVYTNNTGEVVSGRVFSQVTGMPLTNAVVTAVDSRGGVVTATTDTNGIYALVGIPSSSTCLVTVNCTNCIPGTNTTTIGISANNGTNCGNIWGFNFTLLPAVGPPLISIQPTNQNQTVEYGVSFSTDAGGQLPLSYQWQIGASTNGPWSNLTDTGGYSGSQTPNLTINQVSLSMSGEVFQCSISNGSGTTNTVAVTLTVSLPPSISLGTLAGRPGVAGSSNGTNFLALFNGPHGIAVDSHTNIYVADKNNHVIRVLSYGGSGWVVTTIAGQAGVYGYTNGVGTNALFNGPFGIAVDASGNLYVADTGNDLIRKLTPVGGSWQVSTIAGTVGVRGYVDGQTAEFNLPMGICVDVNDNLYVADEGNHAVREVFFSGSSWSTTTLAGSGAYGSNDGTNTQAQFGQLYGIAVTSAGNLYVVDEFSHTIRQISPFVVNLSKTNWIVTTIAGSAGFAGSADGQGSNARFKNPTGIATDGAGNLYVADNGNNTVRFLAQEGPTNWITLTVAGLAGVSGYSDGNGTNARLSAPFGVAVFNATNIVVADENNDTIRGPAYLAPTNSPIFINYSTKRIGTNSFLLIGWNLLPNPNYNVLYATNISEPVWSILTNYTFTNSTGFVTPTNTTGYIMLPIGNAPHIFYRVVQGP